MLLINCGIVVRGNVRHFICSCLHSLRPRNIQLLDLHGQAAGASVYSPRKHLCVGSRYCPVRFLSLRALHTPASWCNSSSPQSKAVVADGPPGQWKLQFLPCSGGMPSLRADQAMALSPLSISAGQGGSWIFSLLCWADARLHLHSPLNFRLPPLSRR